MGITTSVLGFSINQNGGEEGFMSAAWFYAKLQKFQEKGAGKFSGQ